jgi:hypothetical protein
MIAIHEKCGRGGVGHCTTKKRVYRRNRSSSRRERKYKAAGKFGQAEINQDPSLHIKDFPHDDTRYV